MKFAMNFISSQTCVTFEENCTISTRIKFVDSTFCASYVGMINSVQEIYFPDWCMRFGSAVHELMHALGVLHTHARFDRDNFLNVNLNKDDEDDSNFEIVSPPFSINVVPYEYGSTLHYTADVSGTNSLLPKQMEYYRTLGNRRVTFYDMLTINTAYNCKCPSELLCANGGYTNPSNCLECICPLGYGGVLCDRVVACSVQLSADSYWKGSWISVGSSVLRDTTDPVKAFISINAPKDKIIEVKIVKIENFSCDSGCNNNGVEIKYMGDPRITNPIICCENQVDPSNKGYKAKLNPLLINIYTFLGKNKVTFHYRYVNERLSSYNKTTNGYDNYEYYA
ncbi:Zinc metalloproteinase nas-16 [Caenorhabditis elegans]|nr:Zinc metalloproteinase nas-16 [Caenorhabditis elegans]CAA98503.2 Zinc metalloproteinase nas-16 [Caenorhabditis elegans]|eukprot:NP_505889.2 Zinc metalloproteinase nas-16 [Caenorhabditis elegans]